MFWARTRLREGKVFFENLFQTQCYPIFNNIARSVQDKYGIQGFISHNQLAAAQILRHALCAIPVRRDTILSGIVVEKMEHDGHVFLEPINDGGWVSFRMPVLFIHIYSGYLSILPHALVQPFSQDNTTYWQDWEKFNAFFEAFVTNTHVNLGTQDMLLESLFWNAYGTKQTLETRVKIQKIDIAPLAHQFPSVSLDTVNRHTGGRVDWKSGKYLLLNGRSAPFGDLFLSINGLEEAQRRSSSSLGRRSGITMGKNSLLLLQWTSIPRQQRPLQKRGCSAPL